MIYSYTLSDPSGIHLVGCFKNKRRTVERISAETQADISSSHHYYAASMMNNKVRAKHTDPVPLVPALLAVNKQIHQESHSILYANEFVFPNGFALYNFMLNLGPSGAKYLKKLRLHHWDYSRTMKTYNHACFAVLVWATNLAKLSLPMDTANQLYRDAFPWMEAVGAAKGKVDAALDVISINGESLERSSWNTQAGSSAPKNLEAFRARLEVLLGAQQKRVMATTTTKKKRKTASSVVADEL
jgi:hypothetical protein